MREGLSLAVSFTFVVPPGPKGTAQGPTHLLQPFFLDRKRVGRKSP